MTNPTFEMKFDPAVSIQLLAVRRLLRSYIPGVKPSYAVRLMITFADDQTFYQTLEIGDNVNVAWGFGGYVKPLGGEHV